MTDKREIGAGDVEFTLEGETHHLKPSLEACLALSRARGGLYGPGSLAEGLGRYEFEAYEIVIRAGLGLGPSAMKGLPEQIYKTGLLSLIKPCSTFIAVIANGGQKAAKTEDEEGDDKVRPTSPASASLTEAHQVIEPGASA